MIRGDELDDSLQDWAHVGWDEPSHDPRPSLLIGNGFSRNIWPDFKYDSLFDKASQNNNAHLTDADMSLFKCLKTRNFEVVLSALATSKTVSVALDQHNNLFETHEQSIREALIQAVHSVHVSWSEDNGSDFLEIARELKKYTSIYCTNYDLIVYWSIMREEEREHFVDYFWENPFNILNNEVRDGKKAVHFLHGGLHLCKDNIGQTFKRTNSGDGINLLDGFGIDHPDKTPLFISEGKPKDKFRSIRQSDYLSFLFSRFAKDTKPLVILGHNLGPSDQHIIDAINAHKNRHVAISIRNNGNIRQKKARFVDALPDVELSFFDAATHPLLHENLRIEEAP